jgi:hypothetical protein
MKRIVLAVAATLVVASTALGAGLTGAYFTDRIEVPDSVIKAGTVAVSAEPTAAPLSMDSLAPGSTVCREVTVVNDGSLPVDVGITAAKKAGITALWEALTVRVVDEAGVALYDGPMATLKTTPLRIERGKRVKLAFDVGIPATVTDLAGDYAKVSLYVDAEQVRP